MRKPLQFFLGLMGIGALTVLAGCQTWHPQTGQTLPSGHYLDHPPQFIPPSPQFPLPRELESLQKATAAQAATTLTPIP